MSGWTAGAIVGGSLISGYLGSQGSQNAANTQSQASNQATNAQLQMYNQTQNNLAPYMNAGASVLPQLQGFAGSVPNFGSFNWNPSNDPGYQFRLNQGLQGVMDQSTAMGGGINSGNTLKALMDYGQGQASQSYQQEFNNWLAQNSQALQGQNQAFSQLYNTAGMGQNAAAGVGSAAMQTGTNIGQNIMGAGNASAANSIAQGNIWGSVAQNAFSPTNMNALSTYMNPPSTFSQNYGNGTGAYTYGGQAYANPSYYSG